MLSKAKKEKHDQFLRYKEALQLNREGHMASFKSVTRNKRMADSQQMDGPPVGSYRPDYKHVATRTYNASIFSEHKKKNKSVNFASDILQNVLIGKQKIDLESTNLFCPKLIKTVRS